jgi:O-antigen ligase
MAFRDTGVRLNAATARRAAPSTNALAIGTLILFLVLEYARPLFLAELKLQMVIALAIPVLWFLSRARSWSHLLTAQVLFWLVCVAAIPIASNNYAAFFTARQMYGHVALALGFAWLMAERLAFRRVLWAWLFTMGYVAIYGILHGGTGPGGMIGDENDLALGCVTALPLAYHGLERMSGARRWLSGALAALLMSAIVVSFSRGGFLGLVAVSVYCVAASRHRFKASLTLVLAAVLLVTLAPIGGRKGRSYFDDLKTITETDQGSAKSRRYLWRAATNMWLANPLLGVGGGNFAFAVDQYAPDDPEFVTDSAYSERNWSGTVTHSLYLQVLAEHGTVGFVLLCYVILTHFRILWRLVRDVRARNGVLPEVRRDAEMYAAALGGAVVGLCVAGAFLSVAYYPYLWYFSAMAVALDAWVRRELGPAPGGAVRDPRPSSRWLRT